jgi:hypothetical protein
MATQNPALKVEWALACDYALIDTGGKLSLMGIFERLYAGNFPAVHPLVYIAAQWSGQPGGVVEVELRIWGPSKEMIGTASQHVELGDNGMSGAIMRLSPLPLPAPGEYVFELLGGGISQKHISLIVETIPTS